jgi:outer membrane protein assembly factor BamB/tRNA A-37 threonylcarbamoyl transferase component Bud32
MNAEPNRVEAIFAAAVDKTTSAERAAFLQEACAGDSALRRRVEALLRAHGQAGDFLERAFLEGVHEENGPPAAAAEAIAEAPTMHEGQAAPAPGTQVRYFGDYELLEEIARGGMGVVYKARQRSLDRIVALKMILGGQLVGEQEVQRFLREARTAAQLQHPHIVPIHEIGQHDGQYYFSMDYIEGQSLAERVREHPLPPADAVRYLRGITAAVQYAHADGTLHRDLKPSNVLIDHFDQPRVTDFGLAKRIEGDQGLTATGAVVGTPSYMPPEQAAGKAERMGPASDVYSLGAVLYELVTGRPPFRAATTMDTLLQVLHDDPAAPRLLNPGISRDLETIILKCLAKDPATRYATAEALGDDLRRLSAGEAILAHRPGVLERTSRWVRKQRKNVLVAAIAATVAILLVAGGVIAIERLRLWRLGQLFLATDGPALRAELFTESGELATPPFTVPTQEPLSVPAGPYRLGLRGPRSLDETYLVQIERGKERAFDVGLHEQRLWEPLTVPKTYELFQVDGRTDVLLMSEQGVSRVHGATGEVLWKTSLEAKDQPLLAGFRWDWDTGATPTGLGDYDRRPRLLQPAIDLDNDGTPDLVWASRRQVALLALSGKTGKVLWCFQAPLPPVPPNSRFAQERASHGTVIGTPAVCDVNGDGVPDLIATLVAQEQPDGKVPRWVEAINGRDGKSLWHFDLDSSYFSVPAGSTLPRDSRWVNDQGIAMSSGSGNQGGSYMLYEKESYFSASSGVSVPYAAKVMKVDGRLVVVIAAGTHLVGLDPASGKPMWPAHDLGFWPELAPQFADLDGDGHADALFVEKQTQNGDDRLAATAVALRTRRVLWQVPFRGYWGCNWFQQPFEWPVVADLEGDGKPAVILPTGDIEGGIKWSGVLAVNGSDGSERWRRALCRSSWNGKVQQVNRFLVGPDLNGDGHREVFTAVLDGDPDRAHESNTPRVFDKDYDHPVLLIDALSGADGRSLWWSRQQVTVGSLNHSPKPSVGPLRWWHTGADGWPQLIVPYLPGMPQGEDLPHANYILSAGTGKLLHLSGDYRDVQIADLDGDGIPELVALRANQSDATDRGGKLETIRGEFPAAWRRLGGDWEAAADLDGDGIPDLLTAGPERAQERRQHQGGRVKQAAARQRLNTDKPQTTAISGRDGHILWQTEPTDRTARPTWQASPYTHLQSLPLGCDLDGDGIADLLATYALNTVHMDHKGFSPLVALSGKTGRRIWTADIGTRRWFGPKLLECHDLLGTGTRDVLLVAAMDLGLPPDPSGSMSSNDGQYWLVVLSGEDGKVRWQQPLSERNRQGWNHQGSFAHLLADLNGDGAKDVIIEAGLPNQDGAVQAFSGRDGTLLWKWQPEPRPAVAFNRASRATLALGDLTGQGWLDVFVLHRITIPAANGIPELPGARLVALDGQTGQPKWQWQQNVDYSYNDETNGAVHSRVDPLIVSLDGGKRRAVCVWTYDNQNKGQIFLLDGQGQVLQRRPIQFRLGDRERQGARQNPQYNYSPIYGNLFRVWCHDLDGDGSDELIVFTSDKLQVLTGGLQKVLWEWPLPDESCDLLEIQPATADHPATLVVRAGSRILGLGGPDGKLRWHCLGTGTPVAVLSFRDDQALPRVVYDLGDQATVCRLALPTTAEAEPSTGIGLQPFAESTEEDPRSVVPLPFGSIPNVMPLFSHSTFGFWELFALSMSVLVLPALVGRWAVRRRRWRVLYAQQLWLILVWAIACLWRWLQPDGDWTISERGVMRFVAEAGLVTLLLAVEGLPTVAFVGFAVGWVRRRQWARLASLALASVVLSAAVAGIWLHYLAPAPGLGQHYSFTGWYAIAPQGAYLAGLVMLAGMGLRGMFRGVAWGFRRIFARPAAI